MKIYPVSQSFRGWYVGNFPCAYQTEAFELAFKTYKAGECEAAHVHRIAAEITLVVSGCVRMNGQPLHAGEAAVIAPGEPCAFEAVTDAATVVSKTPSVIGDKYMTNEKKGECA